MLISYLNVQRISEFQSCDSIRRYPENSGIVIIVRFYIKNNFFIKLNATEISKIEVISLPGNQKKIDVGYGDDYWILTENNELYHKSMMLQKFVYKRSDVLDFAVGLDGTVAYIDINNEVYVRSMNADWWYKIADGSYAHQTISICDYKTIFTTNDNFDFIKGVYDYKIDDKLDMYNWEYVVLFGIIQYGLEVAKNMLIFTKIIIHILFIN
uniref:Uncharacterized protein n=1 Tax=Rhizophagus irregularis (strain DAOM 181602 / DAOM 197198 / MUCL 43194) TaxID=747089 RepID=U9UDB6_RHIID